MSFSSYLFPHFSGTILHTQYHCQCGGQTGRWAPPASIQKLEMPCPDNWSCLFFFLWLGPNASFTDFLFKFHAFVYSSCGVHTVHSCLTECVLVAVLNILNFIIFSSSVTFLVRHFCQKIVSNVKTAQWQTRWWTRRELPAPAHMSFSLSDLLSSCVLLVGGIGDSLWMCVGWCWPWLC